MGPQALAPRRNVPKVVSEVDSVELVVDELSYVPRQVVVPERDREDNEQRVVQKCVQNGVSCLLQTESGKLFNEVEPDAKRPKSA